MSVNKYNSTTGNLERRDGYIVDSTPTSGSGNPVSSGGVYDALADYKLKKATGPTNALQNAKSYVLLVGKGTYSQDAKIALTLQIPLASLDTTTRYFQVGDSYNGESFLHLQAKCTNESIFDVHLYNGPSLISNEVIEAYYD